MRAPATPFFRDLRMPSMMSDAVAHERFMLDTLAERRAEEKPRRRIAAWKAMMTRAGLFR